MLRHFLTVLIHCLYLMYLHLRRVPKWLFARILLRLHFRKVKVPSGLPKRVIGIAAFLAGYLKKAELALRYALVFEVVREGVAKEFEIEGLRCVLLRGPFLQWNGYVGIPLGHPLYGIVYDQEHEGLKPVRDLKVHGGITYADDHVPGFQPDGLWYFGFDCSHYRDFFPLNLFPFPKDAVYRDLVFAENELKKLASQLLSLSPFLQEGHL